MRRIEDRHRHNPKPPANLGKRHQYLQLRDDRHVENSQKRFQRLKVKGFRRLLDDDLELRPLNVLIGANGVGKTSILDAFSTLASSAQGNLSESIKDMAGLSTMITCDRASEIGFGISMSVPEHEPLDYLLNLRPQGHTHWIERETLIQKRAGHKNPFIHIDSKGSDIKYFAVGQNKLLRPTWEHNPLESSLSQVPKMFREPEEFR